MNIGITYITFLSKYATKRASASKKDRLTNKITRALTVQFSLCFFCMFLLHGFRINQRNNDPELYSISWKTYRWSLNGKILDKFFNIISKHFRIFQMRKMSCFLYNFYSGILDQSIHFFTNRNRRLRIWVSIPPD